MSTRGSEDGSARPVPLASTAFPMTVLTDALIVSVVFASVQKSLFEERNLL